jgi:GDP-D-mannose dehydratase
VERLIGNPEKARKHLHWSAQTKFADLVRLMVDADVKLLAERHGRPVRG